MRVLVCCESSGTVRDAFMRRGHYAMSCDLLETQTPGHHHKGDVFEVIEEGWDLMIGHPPCTYLASSGMHWTTRGKRDPQLTEFALDFFRALLEAPVPAICLENPVGVVSTRLKKPTQYIQPYEFGDDASKKTGLWLKNLPKLQPTGPYVEPRWVVDENGKKKPRWANQTDSGQNKLPPSEDRWRERSKTYPGIANAMAAQWDILWEVEDQYRSSGY